MSAQPVCHAAEIALVVRIGTWRMAWTCSFCSAIAEASVACAGRHTFMLIGLNERCKTRSGEERRDVGFCADLLAGGDTGGWKGQGSCCRWTTDLRGQRRRQRKRAGWDVSS